MAVVTGAKNLTYLYFGDCFSYFEWRPRPWDPPIQHDLDLQNLLISSQLVELGLQNFSVELFDNRSLSLALSRVEILSLSYWEYEAACFHDIVKRISRGECKALKTLYLDWLWFETEEDDILHGNHFLGVRELVVDNTRLGITSFELAHLAPRLQILRLSPTEEDEDACFLPLDTSSTDNAARDDATPLRLLSVVDAYRSCPERLSWRADTLFSINNTTKSSHLAPAFNVCDASKLVGLRIRFAQTMVDLWKAVVQHAPQLQWIELENLKDTGKVSMFNQIVSASHTHNSRELASHFFESIL